MNRAAEQTTQYYQIGGGWKSARTLDETPLIKATGLFEVNQAAPCPVADIPIQVVIDGTTDAMASKEAHDLWLAKIIQFMLIDFLTKDVEAFSNLDEAVQALKKLGIDVVIERENFKLDPIATTEEET